MLTVLIIVCIGFAVLGAVLVWPVYRDPTSGTLNADWKNKKIQGPIGGVIILVSLVVLGVCYWKYTDSFQAEAERQKARADQIDADLRQARGDKQQVEDTLTRTKEALTGAQSQLQERQAEATRQQLRFEAEQEERRRAQAMLRAAWELMNDNLLSPDQKNELRALSDKVDALNDRLTYLHIAKVPRPQLEGRPSIGVYEIYSKAFGADATQPRGAGLFDFQTEQFRLASDYNGRLLEVVKTEFTPALCRAAHNAMVEGISPAEAISRIPPISSYDFSVEFKASLAEFEYVQRQFSLMAGDARTLVRGYADDQRAQFRRKLEGGPHQLVIHEEVGPNELTFRQTRRRKPVGQEDNGASTYGNDDLPNLRAAVTAELIGAVTCTPPGVPAAAMPVSVELLDGRVYPEFRKQDRRARVYLIAFLKQK